jgi:curved DNA-binding protein
MSLGVDRKATPTEIKKAFRNLAIRFHPDRNFSDKVAEDAFKEINEAYTVLSDPKKKQEYDTFGSRSFPKQRRPKNSYRNFEFDRSGLWGKPRRGGDVEQHIDVSLR